MIYFDFSIPLSEHKGTNNVVGISASTSAFISFFEGFLFRFPKKSEKHIDKPMFDYYNIFHNGSFEPLTKGDDVCEGYAA